MNGIQSNSLTSTIMPVNDSHFQLRNFNTLQVTTNEDGKQQTIIKDDQGLPIRYIPSVSLSEEISIRFEMERTQNINLRV